MQGVSFLPKFRNRKEYKDREAIYYHYYENGEHAVSPHFGIKTSRYKLIRFYTRVNSWELFDLKADPSEMKNLYNVKKYRKVADKLKQQLRTMIEKYDDKDAAEILDR
jgi:arylsulfatase A-like enzyme